MIDGHLHAQHGTPKSACVCFVLKFGQVKLDVMDSLTLPSVLQLQLQQQQQRQQWKSIINKIYIPALRKFHDDYVR